MVDLSIIIPVFNNANFTKVCLKHLSEINLDKEIIIVDNNSTDNTKDIVEQFNVKYIKNNSNLGFSKANNIAYSESIGENILFLNNDIQVKDRFQNWPSILINSCKDGIVGVQSGRLDNNYNYLGEGKINPMLKGAYLSGWCLLAKRNTWNNLILPNQKGPWNEDYFLYFEDGDLSFRAKKNNISLYITDIPVHHFSRVTGKKYNMFHFFKKSQRIFKKRWPQIV